MKEQQPDDSGAKPNPPPTPKTLSTFASLKRDLSEDELLSSGCQKMILRELERLEMENDALKSTKDQFHSADKQLAIATQKLDQKIRIEVISSAMIAVGGILCGFARMYWDLNYYGMVLLTGGLVLLGAGFGVKFFKP